MQDVGCRLHSFNDRRNENGKGKKLAPAKKLEKEITLSRTGGGSTGIPNQS
jgi:hypothetical protein